jgi:hypothetical protein
MRRPGTIHAAHRFVRATSILPSAPTHIDADLAVASVFYAIHGSPIRGCGSVFFHRIASFLDRSAVMKASD